MQFTQEQILCALDKLGIKFEVKSSSKEWISCLCPYHPDKHFGNAFIHSSGGGFNCFACNTKSHIVKIVQNRMGVSYRSALEFLGISSIQSSRLARTLRQRKASDTSLPVKNVALNTQTVPNDATEVLENFDPMKFHYTRVRGFTKAFVNHFGIQMVVSGRMKDYLYIPIQSSKLGINFVEYRKLKEYEYFKQLYPDEPISDELKSVRSRFKKDFQNYEPLEGSTDKKDMLISYLQKPRVKFNAGSKTKEGLFNFDCLNFDEDLFVTEGIPGLAKIWSFVSQNCTSFQGVSFKATSGILDLFRMFKKRIIVIRDADDAGDNFIFELNECLGNVWVYEYPLIDTQPEYVDIIRNHKPIECMRYFIRKTKVLL